MDTATARLRSLSVGDVMATNIVLVESSQKMPDVARLFLRHGISAAPVIDEQGRCAGVISAADFLRRDCDLAAADAAEEHRLVDEGDSLRIAFNAEDRAHAYMTATVQTITPEQSLLKAATVMKAEHVHRLPVLDPQQRIVGVISTMDIVAALVNAVEEMDLLILKQCAK